MSEDNVHRVEITAFIRGETAIVQAEELERLREVDRLARAVQTHDPVLDDNVISDMPRCHFCGQPAEYVGKWIVKNHADNCPWALLGAALDAGPFLLPGDLKIKANDDEKT
jgi:hypothetical protein